MQNTRPDVDRISRAGWRWFGYAGHFVGGKRCAFHLATLVAGDTILVSTLGHYLPRSGDGNTPEPLGSGSDTFETMVFRCNGIESTGDPNVVDFSAIDMVRYASSLEAERGHYAVCEKWADGAVS